MNLIIIKYRLIRRSETDRWRRDLESIRFDRFDGNSTVAPSSAPARHHHHPPPPHPDFGILVCKLRRHVTGYENGQHPHARIK